MRQRAGRRSRAPRSRWRVLLIYAPSGYWRQACPRATGSAAGVDLTKEFVCHPRLRPQTVDRLHSSSCSVGKQALAIFRDDNLTFFCVGSLDGAVRPSDRAPVSNARSICIEVLHSMGSASSPVEIECAREVLLDVASSGSCRRLCPCWDVHLKQSTCLSRLRDSASEGSCRSSSF